MFIYELLNDRKTKSIAGAFFAILIFSSALRWAGRTTDIFILGGFLFALMMFLFFVFQFWLFYVDNPYLTNKEHVKPLLPPLLYRFIAVLLAAATTHIVIGGMWDEIWHITYNLPFGDDLFWPPHLMLYFCFLTILILGALVWWLFFFRIKGGNLRQRFAKDPALGLALILGQYTLIVLPMDPIWHEWYGADISAWSVPHVLLFTGGMGMFFLAFLIMRITVGSRKWGVFKLSLRDVLNVFVLSSFLFLSYQMLFEYEPARSSVPEALMAQRPEWLLPVLATMIVVSTSTFSTHVLRFPMATTLSVFLALVARNVLIMVFAHDGVAESSTIAVIILGPVFILDLLQWYHRGQASILQIGLVSGFALFLNYPVYSLWFNISLSETTYLLLTFVMILFSIFISWLAIGLSNFHEEIASKYDIYLYEGQKKHWFINQLPALLFAGNILIICYAIITAEPPV